MNNNKTVILRESPTEGSPTYSRMRFFATLRMTIVILLASAFIFALHPQKRDQFINAVRGDKTTLNFSVTGNITARKLDFVVKESKYFSSPRLIWKQNTLAGGDSSEVYASYNGTLNRTTVQVTLLPIDTWDLYGEAYVYDLLSTSTTDTNSVVTVYDGVLKILFDVQTPFDGANLPGSGGRITTIALSNGDTDSSFVMWDDVNELYEPVSKATVKSVLDLVDRSSWQNVPARKNFLSDIKLGADSNTTLSALNTTINSPIIKKKRTSGTYFPLFQIIPPDANLSEVPDMLIYSGFNDFIPGEPGIDYVFNYGTNQNSRLLHRPQWTVQLESNYERSATQNLYEWFSDFQNYPSPYTTFAARPIGTIVVVDHAADTLYSVENGMTADVIYWNNQNNQQVMKWMFKNENPNSLLAHTNSNLLLMDSTRITAGHNNYGWLFQNVAAENSQVELMRLDEENMVVIDPGRGPTQGAVRIPSRLVGDSTISALMIGYTTTKNNGINFLTNGNGGAFWYNADSSWFGFIGAGDEHVNPADWQSNAPDNYLASIYVNGGLLIGTKQASSLQRGITLSYTLDGNDPGTSQGQASIYVKGYFGDAALYVKDPSGTVTNLSRHTVSELSPTAPNRTISFIIDGTTYYVAAKTTND